MVVSSAYEVIDISPSNLDSSLCFIQLWTNPTEILIPGGTESLTLELWGLVGDLLGFCGCEE